MTARCVWVQQTDIGRLRTWHLEGAPGETLCARSTQPMKALPGAVWDQVLNPCPACQKEPDVADVVPPAVDSAQAADSADPPGGSDVVDAEVPPGKHARRD